MRFQTIPAFNLFQISNTGHQFFFSTITRKENPNVTRLNRE